MKSYFSNLLGDLKSVLPFLIIVLMFQELGENMWRTRGLYHFRRLIYFVIPFLFFIWASLRFKSFKLEVKKYILIIEKILLLSSTYLLWKFARNNLVIHKVENIYSNIIPMLQYGAFGIVFICNFITNKISEKKLNLLILVSVVILLISQLLVPLASPNPHIDVFTSNTDAVKYFLSGVNPYGAEYKDIYNGLYDYTPGYVYWPSLLMTQSLSYILFSDIRYALILSNICIVLAIYKLIPMRKIALLIILLWSSLPIQLFIIEQSWIDPLLVCFLIWSWYFLQKEKILYAGIFLGIGCATKQYGAVVAILYGIFCLKSFGLKKFFNLIIFSLIPFLMLMLPFWMLDFTSWKKMTMDVPLSQNMRLDSFSVVASLVKEFGIVVNKYMFSIPPFITLILVIIGYFKNRLEILNALFILFTVIFLFGKQAFCNYYYLASIFLIMSLANYFKKENYT